MSSPAGVQCSQTDLLALWMPSSSRAGVLLNPYPDTAAPAGHPLCLPSPGPNDSFSSYFGPLPASADSSCVALEPLSRHTQMEQNKEPGDEAEDVDSFVEMAAQSHDVSLVMKLEQLRQWQQHMQEQLRAQQLQELLQLQQEQHRLLELMSTQPQATTENVEEVSEADWGEATLHSNTLCHVQTTVGQVPDSPHPEAPRSVPLSESPEPLTHPSAGQEGEASACCSGEEEQSQAELSRMWAHAPELQSSSPHEETSVRDRPIKPGCTGQRTFEEMLEEQLRCEEKRLKSEQQSNLGGEVHPKRAFLKKGEGLLRFTGQKATNKDSRPPPLAKAIIRSHSEPISLQHRQTDSSQKLPLQRKTASVCKDFPSTSSFRQDTKSVRLKMLQSHLPLHTPQSGSAQRFSEGQANTLAEPTTRRASCGGTIPVEIRPGQVHSNSSLEPSAQGEGGAKDSLEKSFQERLMCWESARQQESVELGEFELLEQAAEELSFSSNSSFVLKVLQMDQQRQLHQRRLSSTPIKTSLGPRDPLKAEGHRQPQCESEEDQADKQVPLVPSVFTFPSQSSPPYNKCTYEDVDSRQEESSEAEDTDSADGTMTEHPEEQAEESTMEQQGEVQFDDHDTWSQLSEDRSFSTASPEEPSSPAERAVTRKVAPTKVVEVEKQPAGPAPSKLMSKLFPALKTQSHNAPVNHSPTGDPRSVPSTTHAQQAQSQLLKERLLELEIEIERFKKENAALTKLRKDNQKLQEDLRRERCEFEQMKAQEMSCFEEYKREESRKLQRERRLLEKHMAAARMVPNKSERQEIQALKQQLSSLQEELRRKESRWANTHSRQRHQLEALGQDNSALREEVKTLEKLRLMAWKKTSTDSDKSFAPKGVKFATPLDSSSSPLDSPPAADTRANRRASAPGASTLSGRRSSLRTPSLLGRRAKESEPEAQNQSSLSLEATPGGTLNDSQLAPEPGPGPAPEPGPGPGPEPGPDPGPDPGPRPASDCEGRLQALQEEVPAEGKVEQLLPSGARLIVFPNGTKKEVSPDGRTVRVTFFNGDTKELTADQRVIYFYAEAKTTHITYPGGMEVLHFPNDQTEKHFPDGHKEITFPDHTVKTLYPNGREESVLPDGTIVQVHPDGRKEIHFNTGQREVHTGEYKRREYPDGTVKTVYSNGRQETRYPTGRLRIKDQEGNVILDNKA